jgi:hypothetical protein
MATTCRLNNGSVLNQPHRAYVTTGAFADAIFSYTTSTSVSNGQVVTTGVLAALGASVVTSTYNVAGTILRENGRKIVPGVNPITQGTVQYYVGVYHPVFGSGFIDPNNALFAVYNSDKPYIYNGGDLLENDLGPPVITGGSIASTSPTAGIGYATGAGGTQSAPDATPVTLNKICGRLTFTGAINNGATGLMVVNNTTVDEYDVIIINLQNGAALSATGAVDVRIYAVADNQFTVAITNNSGGTITTDFVMNFAVIKSVHA